MFAYRYHWIWPGIINWKLLHYLFQDVTAIYNNKEKEPVASNDHLRPRRDMGFKKNQYHRKIRLFNK